MNCRPCRAASLASFFLLLSLAAVADQAFGEGRDYVVSHYTKYEYRIPMRDGTKLFTAVYSPKDHSQPYPILLTRTPCTACGHMAWISTKRTWAPAPTSVSRRTSSSIRTCAGGGCPKESSSTSGRTSRIRKDRKTSTRRSDTCDTIDWLMKNLPNHNGRVGMYGISYPGLLHVVRHDRRPPGPEGGLAAGAGDRLVHGGRLASQRRVFSGGMPSISCRRRSVSRPADQEIPVFVRPWYADGYDFFLNLVRWPRPISGISRNAMPYWDEVVLAPELRRVLESACNVRQHMKNIRPAILTVARLVRCRESLRGDRNLQGDRGEQPEHPNTAGDGAVAPRRLVARRWRRAGRRQFQFEAVDSFARISNCRSSNSISRARGTAVFPEAWVFETGTSTGKSYDTWPPKGSAPLAFLAAGGTPDPTCAPHAEPKERTTNT